MLLRLMSLDHLSRRLMSELKVYQSLRRPSVHQHFQTSSPLKPLGQLNSNFILRLLRTREWKIVQMVLVTWPRWPPHPYNYGKNPLKIFSRTRKRMTLGLAGKELTPWLSFLVSNCEFVLFPLVPWVRCGTRLYRFLIFAPFLTLVCSFGDVRLTKFVQMMILGWPWPS